MFHMSRAIYDKAVELGKLMAESDTFLALKAAEEAGQNDPELSKCVSAYLEKRQRMEEETMKEEKDFDLIAALAREIDEESQRMNALPAYEKLQKAREGYNMLMSGINDVLYATLYPDTTCSCSGNCATCGGCSHPMDNASEE
ncbi:MAG: YlbF family regulator [Clostridia bacterium]|nr:YlbF family regulator [Clostridia bacterium]